MKIRLYILLLCFIPVLAFAVQPTTLQIIDIRSQANDADFMAKMMSLQGAINRQSERNLPAIFLVRNNNDIYWADLLTNTYRLKRENIISKDMYDAYKQLQKNLAGAISDDAKLKIEKTCKQIEKDIYGGPNVLNTASFDEYFAAAFSKYMENVKVNIKAQVVYNAAEKPWNRNVALAFAGASDDTAIVTTEDMGLPSLDFPKDGWDNRIDAYKWEQQNLGDKTNKDWLGLIPESGSAIMDMVSAKKMMAIDLDPSEEADKVLLEEYVKNIADAGKIIGYPDKRTDNIETAQMNIIDIIGDRDLRYLPARFTGNLSCYMRFESTRPFRQWRDEITTFVATADKKTPNWLVLIYNGGSPRYDGSQSIDTAMSAVTLLEDPAMAVLPVGVEIPMPIGDLAPPIYSQLIARQRVTKAELISAPNGDGWGMPLAMNDNSNYIIGSAEKAKKLDITSVVTYDEAADSKKCAGLYTMMAAAKWRSTFVFPTKNFMEKRSGITGVMPDFTAMLGFDQANSPAELTKVLEAKNESNFRVVFINPNGLPPAVLKEMLPEIEKTNTIITPSQAVREMEEFTRVKKLLSADNKTSRGEPTLSVSSPAVAGGDTPRVYTPITVNVRVSAGGGAPNVMLARLQYETPDGRVGAADLSKVGTGNTWSAIVPPSLQEGKYRIRARMVDGVGGGISFSPYLEMNFTAADLDNDGANDAWESYLGTNPQRADTDGDGLPDGVDQQPLLKNRKIQLLSPAYNAASDKVILANAGSSIAGVDGRDIPEGTSITYKLPVSDISTNGATLRIISAKMTDFGGRTGWSTSITDLPQSADKMANGSLSVTLSAKNKPMRILSVGLVSNPNGPFVDNVELSCADKRAVDIIPGKLPINVKAIVYSPAGISEAVLMYGTSTKSMQKIVLQGDRLKTTFTGVIPPQPDGTVLVYSILAKDNDGNESLSPYQTLSIGKNKAHSVALLAGRDLTGDMRNDPLWNGTGRSTVSTSAIDSGLFFAHPGTYTVWALAAPRDRGLTVKLDKKNTTATTVEQIMNGTVPANLPDGWYRVGTFSVMEGTRLTVSVLASGFTGFAAYGEIVLTQDNSFNPPAKNAVIDWTNGLSVTGIVDGMKITRPVSIFAFASGNIDTIHVNAKRFGSGVSRGGALSWTIGPDGHLILDPTELISGEYVVVISGDTTYKDGGVPITAPLVQDEFYISMPK